MPVGTSLVELVDQFRFEIGSSTGAGQGVNTRDAQRHLLRATQQRLWLDYAWPHMKVETDESLLAGQRYYTFDSRLDFHRTEWVKVRYSTQWQRVSFQADFSPLYNVSDSDADVRQDPVQFWRHYESGQYEVWPIPASAQTLRFRGVRNLSPLTEDAHLADLDDRVIVLFAAARQLKRNNSTDADNVLAEANTHLNRLKASSVKSDTIIIGGGRTVQEYADSCRGFGPGWEVQVGPI